MSYSAPPSIAVDLFLSAMFLFAFRWIKRNPSSFLRYMLFPFGGLHVERWPRILLVMVRGAAILGFFSFFLAFMSLLAPGSFAHPTPGVLYTKFAVAILVAFLALRGSAKPGESGDAAEPRPLAAYPQAAPKSAPIPPKDMAISPNSTPAIAKPAPTLTQSLPSAPLALSSRLPRRPSGLPRLRPVPRKAACLTRRRRPCRTGPIR